MGSSAFFALNASAPEVITATLITATARHNENDRTSSSRRQFITATAHP
jgi:hypothetical protein